MIPLRYGGLHWESSDAASFYCWVEDLRFCFNLDRLMHSVCHDGTVSNIPYKWDKGVGEIDIAKALFAWMG
jgi:hypothetical protein